MTPCGICVDLLEAAIKATERYHNALADLEFAWIRGDDKLIDDLHPAVLAMNREREAARASLRKHQSTHFEAAITPADVRARRLGGPGRC